jgi:hypothetical protein
MNPAEFFRRLIASGLRKYGEQPGEERAAVRFILRQAIGLALQHTTRQDIEKIVRDAVNQPVEPV